MLALMGTAIGTAGAQPAPGAPAVEAALDSLALSEGLHRSGLFLGDLRVLEEAAAVRRRALQTLDAAPAARFLELDWPRRIQWLERALEERRTDWSSRLVQTLGTDLPPDGSPGRGPAALAAGLNALAAVRAYAPLWHGWEIDDQRLVAEEFLRAAAAEDFLLRDEALYRLFVSALDREDTTAARAWADSLVMNDPRSLRAPSVRLIRVRHLYNEGRYAEAIDEGMLAQDQADGPKLRRLLAECRFGQGLVRQAARELESIVGSFGATAAGHDAYRRRLELEAMDPELHLTRGERIALWSALLGGAHGKGFEDSLRGFWADTALAVSTRRDAARALIDHYYAVKRYPEAEAILGAALRELPPAERGPFRLVLARILRNTARTDSMVVHYRLLRDGGGAEAGAAAWELPREMESVGRWGDADSAYTVLLERFPGHGRRLDAVFRRGFARFRLDRYAEAADDFRDAFRLAPEDADRERAAFWRALALERSGDAEGAEQAGRAGIYRSQPEGYYGIRLRERFAAGSPDTGGVAPPLRPEESPEVLIAESAWPGPVERHVRRGLALASLGELEQARAEWRRAAALGRGAQRLERVLALAAATHGVYPEGVTWARRTALDLPGGDPRRVGYERLGYPAAFYGDVAGDARRAGVDPALVWAIMRQESLYDPRAVSRAGALGLLQILPATLTRVIREGWFPQTPVDGLFRPDINIELGVRFFADRLEEFGGHVLPALASYNAGEGKSREWIDLAGGDTGDVFVECIGYPETYGYVQRITWLKWIYDQYYASAPDGR